MFVSTLLTNPTVALNIVQSGGWGGGLWPSGTFLVSSLRSDPRKITTPVFDTEKIFCRNRNIFDSPYSILLYSSLQNTCFKFTFCANNCQIWKWSKVLGTGLKDVFNFSRTYSKSISHRLGSIRLLKSPILRTRITYVRNIIHIFS